jgi:Zn-dependent protease
LSASGAIACADCGTDVAPALLACPRCHRLVHGERLRELVAAAEDATRREAWSEALAAWRDAASLLPAGSRQRAIVEERIAGLSQRVDAGAPPAQKPRNVRGWIVAGGLLALGKAKFLFAGLTKAGTIVSMLLAFGVYWTAWGWRFAAGFTASIFVHEMGHVAALARYGVRATMPMFIPGVGAVVRFQQGMAPTEESRVALAGPLWGLGAALVALAAAVATGSRLAAAVAHTGAWVNLFNLVPIVPLDGGRGFRALDRLQRLGTLPVLAGVWWVTGDGLLVLALIVAVARAFEPGATTGDARAFMQYTGLVVALSIVADGATRLAALPAP